MRGRTNAAAAAPFNAFFINACLDLESVRLVCSDVTRSFMSLRCGISAGLGRGSLAMVHHRANAALGPESSCGWLSLLQQA